MDAIFAGLIADGGEWPERVDLGRRTFRADADALSGSFVA
jgi:hypothetical protein